MQKTQLTNDTKPTYLDFDYEEYIKNQPAVQNILKHKSTMQSTFNQHSIQPTQIPQSTSLDFERKFKGHTIRIKKCSMIKEIGDCLWLQSVEKDNNLIFLDPCNQVYVRIEQQNLFQIIGKQKEPFNFIQSQIKQFKVFIICKFKIIINQSTHKQTYQNLKLNIRNIFNYLGQNKLLKIIIPYWWKDVSDQNTYKQLGMLINTLNYIQKIHKQSQIKFELVFCSQDDNLWDSLCKSLGKIVSEIEKDNNKNDIV